MLREWAEWEYPFEDIMVCRHWWGELVEARTGPLNVQESEHARSKVAEQDDADSRVYIGEDDVRHMFGRG